MRSPSRSRCTRRRDHRRARKAAHRGAAVSPEGDSKAKNNSRLTVKPTNGYRCFYTGLPTFLRTIVGEIFCLSWAKQKRGTEAQKKKPRLSLEPQRDGVGTAPSQHDDTPLCSGPLTPALRDRSPAPPWRTSGFSSRTFLMTSAPCASKSRQKGARKFSVCRLRLPIGRPGPRPRTCLPSKD